MAKELTDPKLYSVYADLVIMVIGNLGTHETLFVEDRSVLCGRRASEDFTESQNNGDVHDTMMSIDQYGLPYLCDLRYLPTRLSTELGKVSLDTGLRGNEHQMYLRTNGLMQ